MRKRTLTIGVLAAVALLAVGGLFASNMGFKLNYSLLSASDAGSLDGTNTLGLPFNRQTGINTAAALITDIGSGSVQNVQRYVESSGAIETRTSGGAGPDFNLAEAEGYFIKMSANVPYIVVGSHDPGFGVDLDAASEPDSLDGTNFYAYAYHSTVSTAATLITDIGSGNVQNVQRYVPSTGAIETRTSGGAGPNFNLAPGEAYFVKMNSTVSYVPSHY